MVILFPLYALLFALFSYAVPLKMVVNDPHSLMSSRTWLDSNSAVDPKNLHQSFFKSGLSLKKELSFTATDLTIAGQTITRSTPMIDGVATEGVEGVFVKNPHYEQFYYTHFTPPKTSFRLSAAECMERALAKQAYSIIKDPYVEETKGMYEPIWLMHFGELRPAFKVRLPTISIFDLKDIYVDAEHGEILRIDDTAQFALHQAPANLFVYSPQTPDLEASLKPVTLTNLAHIEENGFLQGQYLSVHNCCKYYTCPESGPCTDKEKRCAHKSHPNAQQSREIIELPTDTLGLDPMINLPNSLTVDAIRCTYLPFAKASFKNSQNQVLGFFDVPVDNESPESETDRFSEIQAYFSVSTFFNHIRVLLDNQSWCLRKEAMDCNQDGSPVLDADGNPKNPYRVFVNQMIPDMKVPGQNSQDADSFLAQVMAGRGKPDDPIVLNQFARIGNAAFIPALSTLKKTTPRADEILSDLIKPYDHNVFFQGTRDFAYDGDVVFHEFMHAITTSLIGKLNNLGLDSWGIHAEPGSLNEGWSDYFAASFTNKPSVGAYASTKDGFGEASLRNIDNTASCPHDVIGEAHHDSLIWSGALWEIRNQLKAASIGSVLEFDRAVLLSLAQATISEDFKTQSEKLINTLLVRPNLGEKAASIARAVFEQRKLNDCFRAYTLSTVDERNRLESRIKNLLFVPSKNQIGLKNYAPATMQLEVGIPAGAKNLVLSWRQFLPGNGAMLGTEATPQNTKNIDPLEVLYNLDLPIVWKFVGAKALATSMDQEITNTTTKASYHNGYWQASIPLSFEQCEQKVMYVSLLSTDFKYVVENIHVSFDIDETKDLSKCDFFGSRRIKKTPPPLACSSKTSSPDLFLLLALVLLWIMRMTRVDVMTKE